jgi:hypothetical protein
VQYEPRMYVPSPENGHGDDAVAGEEVPSPDHHDNGHERDHVVLPRLPVGVGGDVGLEVE